MQSPSGGKFFINLKALNEWDPKVRVQQCEQGRASFCCKNQDVNMKFQVPLETVMKIATKQLCFDHLKHWTRMESICQFTCRTDFFLCVSILQADFLFFNQVSPII